MKLRNFDAPLLNLFYLFRDDTSFPLPFFLFFLIKVVMNRIREEGCINYIDKTWWKIDFVRNIIFVPWLALKVIYIYIYTIVTLNRMELLFNFINLLRNILRDIMFYTFIVLRVCRDFSLFFFILLFLFLFPFVSRHENISRFINWGNIYIYIWGYQWKDIYVYVLLVFLKKMFIYYNLNYLSILSRCF